MADFVMPALGADMESGTLIEWLKKPGDSVSRGDIMAVVGTEKGEIEVELFDDGFVGELLVSEGDEVPVGAPMATIRPDREAEGASTPVKAAITADVAEAVPVPQAASQMASAAVTPTSNGHRIRVSPLARKLAGKLGVDLAGVHGTGPNGAISREDVEQAAAGASKASIGEEAVALPAEKADRINVPSAKKVEPTASKAAKKQAADAFQLSMRKAIAAAMARANAEIPHYYLETRIDMSKALAWLEDENRERSIKDRVLPVVLLIKAVALGLAKVPALNGFWIDDRFQPSEGIHIGFAIALRQGGLITPAIHHADLKDMDELMAAMRDLIMRTRAGRLRSSELTDATVVLTSLGDMGVEKVFGVIYPPQVALVGFGKIDDQVWVENGLMGVRPVIHATVAGDHRATDGRTGGEFLDTVNKLLQEPETLWT
jgi:pyruvate dehydrogenase E2 component (dihydrolipoamide acetyltransferase)